MMECESKNINYNCNNAVDSIDEFPSSLRVCHGCKLSIEDDFSLHVSPNLDWHVSCLICCECHEYMDENCETCFIKDGRPYCRSDYIRLFGIQCAKCSEYIKTNTLIMRAKHQIFHVECFQCYVCEKKLTSGDQFGLAMGKLYCKTDFEALSFVALETTMEAEMVDSSETLHNGRPNIITPNCTTPSSMLPTSSTPPVTKPVEKSIARKNGTTEQKQPRIRTVLTEQQLQTLRTVYQTNPRPDALLKEQLCELTGLSARVIRVWFQNRRCKDKKALQKAEAARLQSGGKVLPMTPQTPITPDSMNQVSPHQAFTYPLPAYDHVTTPTLTPTPSNTCVSPIVPYQHNSVWTSPTDTVSPFDPTVDFSSPLPITTENFIYSQSHLPQPTTVSHFSF